MESSKPLVSNWFGWITPVIPLYKKLHSAPAGLRLCRTHGSMDNTNRLSERLIRMPLWNEMTEEHVDKVMNALTEILRDG